jgi:hypothetical protein
MAFPNFAASSQFKFPATFLTGSFPLIGNNATSTAKGFNKAIISSKKRVSPL